MNNAKHTPGPVKVNTYRGRLEVRQPLGGYVVADCGMGLPEDQANADLIVEAFNVATETGRTPRQLADRVKQLEAMVARFIHTDEAGEL